MVKEVLLDNKAFSVTDFKQELERGRKSISFTLKVQGGQHYHDVTSFLYKNAFEVRVPEMDLAFSGKIYEYSTSLADYSDENSFSNFKLRLIEEK
ncbi:hypothetical protein JOD43_000462 [Pullulanibacillus pueri]|uniref:DUF3219 family protein n=1 Tax=Pullulanibacillus pueri TaxID=1437324 RepID=A0A8J2ZSZ4_9BACL|nr:DUF3219 family protein [Pullulanibacillus pueri]MBM7680303.1 hypothetical protein [Pullulanibacillus pueri]GGH75749.1 hypothetical protein GCM10007096_05300 [Pullulanibacillus pueri]